MNMLIYGIAHTVRRYRINKSYHFYCSSLDFVYKLISFTHIYIYIYIYIYVCVDKQFIGYKQKWNNAYELIISKDKISNTMVCNKKKRAIKYILN